MYKALRCGFLLVVALLLFGCGAKSADYGGYNDSALMETPAASEPALSLDGSEGIVPERTRKLINRAEISVEADPSLLDREGRLSGANQKVEALLKQYGAYAEQSVVHDDSFYCKIRVPGNSYASLLSGIAVLGKITSRSESAEDVTLKYYDLEGRLDTKKTLQKTFLGYLSRAKDIKEIMEVETRIAELQNEIDWLGTELVRLSNLVDYSTVELRIGTYSAVSRYPLGDRIAGLFRSFGNFAEGGLLVILGIIIFGTPLILFCLLVFWLLFGRIGLLRKAFRLAMGGHKNKESAE